MGTDFNSMRFYLFGSNCTIGPTGWTYFSVLVVGGNAIAIATGKIAVSHYGTAWSAWVVIQ